MTGTRVLWTWLLWGWEHIGVLERTLGALESTWVRGQQVWEHLELQLSSWGKSSCLAMLLVRLEIIATTHHSTVLKTCVFSMYSHLCIFIATHLHMVYLDCLQAVLESKLKWTWNWRLSELRDTLWGRDCARLEMHLEAVIDWVWR